MVVTITLEVDVSEEIPDRLLLTLHGFGLSQSTSTRGEYYY